MFPGQDDSEIVQRVVYKHIFSVLPFLLVALLLFFVGLFLVYAGAADLIKFPVTVLKGLPDSSFQLPYAAIGMIFVAMAVFLWLASIYVWRQNQMILTDENVVDVDQRGIFQKHISTLRLSRVQDISVIVKGPMQTIFRYGTIHIQTAGAVENFEFDYVPDPYEVKAYMVNLFEKFVEKKRHEGDGTRDRTLSAHGSEEE
ncbi:PH domain-containing protein [bacterium]|nr:PH domain-containing protein [bacterium]